MPRKTLCFFLTLLKHTSLVTTHHSLENTGATSEGLFFKNTGAISRDAILLIEAGAISWDAFF